MAFVAPEQETGSVFQYPFAGAIGHWRSYSLNRDIPGRAIEARRDSRNSFFENDTIFAFITPRSRGNLTLKKNFIIPSHYKENNARSAAYQSTRTIVAIYTVITSFKKEKV